MSSTLQEVKRDKEILYVRVEDHFGCPINFRVDFKEKVIQYKDGCTFNGWWKNVETQDFIGVLEDENKL